MINTSTEQSKIIRTERGLTISGTRITLYDVMDYLKQEYPAKFIRGLFDLSEEQINTALSYIKAHPTEVEAEYKLVLEQAKELEKYYTEKKHQLISHATKISPKPGTEAIWEKLQASKAKRQSR